MSATATPAPADRITILRCARGLRLAKLIRPAGIVDYDNTRTFDAWSAAVANLDDLHRILSNLVELPRLCVVRGELIDEASATGIRRLQYPDRETGDIATLRDVHRRWLALDIEGVQRPAGIPATDLSGCAGLALQRLPAAFRGGACIVQPTAGHGIKPDIRLRLWFWLSRPTSGRELKTWLRGYPADPSIFGAAQIIYTAAPVFEGCEDHLPARLLRLDGAASVTVPSPVALAPPPRPAPKPLPRPSSEGASRYAWTALRNAVVKVATAPTDSRHPTCVAQARSLARLVKAGLLTSRDVTGAMAEALLQAGKTREEGEAIAAWALAHPSIALLPDGLR